MTKHKLKYCYQCKKKTTHKLYFFAKNPDFPSRKKIPLIQCKQCKLIISDLNKSVAINSKQYDVQYYGYPRQASFINKIFQEIFNFERKQQAIFGKKVRDLLDYGCGTASFLMSLPSQITRYGFETSKEAIQEIKRNRGSNVKILKKVCISTYKYDVITFWQSLEHIKNPVSLLARIPKLLRDDGYVFISVPNIHSLQARIFRSNWFHLDPKRHLTHFCPQTLINALKKTHLKLDSINTFSFEYGVFGWWQSIFNSLGLEFNMGYKVLKRKVRYSKNIKILVQETIYILAGFPVAVVSVFMALLEGTLGMGAVLQVKARPAKEID